MPGADVVVMGLPALRVRLAQPADEPRQIRIVLGPQNQMPVVGHPSLNQVAPWHLSFRFDQRAQPGSESAGFVQKSAATISPVESWQRQRSA